MTNPDFEKLRSIVRIGGLLEEANGVLQWDAEANMPPGGVKFRGPQMGALAQASHEYASDPRIGELIATLERQQLDETQQTYIKELKIIYERSKKVPSTLIKELSELEAKAHPVWVKAKKENNFNNFKPYLEQIFELVKKYALAIDTTKPIYETLMQDDDYDLSLDEIKQFITEIKNAIVPLIKKQDKKVALPKVPVEKQEQFTRKLIEAMGYDFNIGRLDLVEHPFCTESGRIGTHFKEEDFCFGLFGTIHEFGHAMYTQNQPYEFYGETLGRDRSLSVHESQSRFWENNIALTKEFWEPWFDEMKDEFKLDFELDDFIEYINHSTPSLIRIMADELTYPLHIIIRLELEVDILEGRIHIADIPTAWNEKMQSYLGISPSTDTEGCLQDVHWCACLIGYFPTYLVGSMLAAQLDVAIRKELDVDTLLKNKNYTPIREWLTEKIHSKGRFLPTHELVKQATGKDLSSEDYINYLTKKYG